MSAPVAGPFGFLDVDQLAQLARTDRLRPVLVRCDRGRFTCPAQDAAGLIEAVEAGGWYVRDVSLAAGFQGARLCAGSTVTPAGGAS